MPVGIDTQYTYTQPWSSINTPTGVYKQTPDQIQKMAHAIATASMETSASALRVYAPTNVVVVGLGSKSPTLDDVIDGSAAQPPMMSIFDYSGTAAGMMSSTAPSIPLGA